MYIIFYIYLLYAFCYVTGFTMEIPRYQNLCNIYANMHRKWILFPEL